MHPCDWILGTEMERANLGRPGHEGAGVAFHAGQQVVVCQPEQGLHVVGLLAGLGEHQHQQSLDLFF